jgi:hypothetical protein
LREVQTAFDGRVFGIDNTVSDQWVARALSDPFRYRWRGCSDRIRLANGLMLVARNARDIASLDTTVLDRSRSSMFTIDCTIDAFDVPGRHKAE